MGAAHGTPQVDTHQVFIPTQVVGFDILKQGMRRYPCVIDQYVQAAQLADGGFDQMAALLRIGDVGGHDEGASPHGHAVGRHCLQTRCITRSQHQHGLQTMSSCQLAGQLCANAV